MEYLIGTIVLLPYNFTPQDWCPCEGAQLPVNQYQALFSLIGYQYGGNGSSTFAVPDLRGATPLPGVRYYIALNGIYPTRD